MKLTLTVLRLKIDLFNLPKVYFESERITKIPEGFGEASLSALRFPNDTR